MAYKFENGTVAREPLTEREREMVALLRESLNLQGLNEDAVTVDEVNYIRTVERLLRRVDAL